MAVAIPSENVQINSSDRATGWVFSPALDFCIFWLPFALAYAVKNFNLMESLAVFFILRISIDMSHVLATVVPVGDRLRRKRLGRVVFLTSMIAVPVFAVAMYAYSKPLFMAVLGTNALVHVCRQQFGMLMVSRRNAREGARGRLFDALMMLNLTAVPCLWWLSSLSDISKTYFFQGDLGYLAPWMPGPVISGLLIAHWIFNFAYLAVTATDAVRGRRVNWPKIFLLLSTWVWFYFGLLVLKSAVFFFAAGLGIHGLTYLAFTARDSARRVPSLRDRFSWRKLLLIQGAAAVWAVVVFYLGMPLPGEAKHFMEPVVALPLIVHYCLDAFIWRRGMFG